MSARRSLLLASAFALLADFGSDRPRRRGGSSGPFQGTLSRAKRKWLKRLKAAGRRRRRAGGR